MTINKLKFMLCTFSLELRAKQFANWNEVQMQITESSFMKTTTKHKLRMEA